MLRSSWLKSSETRKPYFMPSHNHSIRAKSSWLLPTRYVPARKRAKTMRPSDATDAELRPYGYMPGNDKAWCVSCSKEHRAAKRSFKCRTCASYQWAEVERLCKVREESER